jgi:hypothetical protein
MPYGLLADLLVAFHVAYVGFVVLGQAAILIGAALRWHWIRNLWFRLAHLAAIGLVALEAVWGMACPLTVWESNLRELAGQEFSGDSFMARLLHRLIFFQVDAAILDIAHILFAILVLATLVLIPPRWGKRARASLPAHQARI